MAANKQQGFTLVEILIALAIFAMLSTIATRGLFSVLSIHKKLSQQSALLVQFATGITLMRQDFRNFIDRPIMDQYGDTNQAFTGEGQQITFTRSSLDIPILRRRSGLQRVSYVIAGNSLIRQTWPVLDRSLNIRASQQVLITGLNNLKFQFYLPRFRPEK